MMDKKEIRKIVDELIKKSFSSLRGKRIYIYFFSRKKYSGGVWWILPFWRGLFINRKRKFNDKQLIGLLVHELCHFEIFQKRGWLKTSFIAGFLYWTSSKHRKKEEENAEKLTIRKGYSKEFYSLEKKFYASKLEASKYYLSPKEIKAYAQKIGKW